MKRKVAWFQLYQPVFRPYHQPWVVFRPPREAEMQRSVAILLGLSAAICSAALAIETPRIIPRSQRIDRPIEQVFGTLKHYFNDSSLSGFRLNNADQKSWTLVATRTDIDGANWNNWAFCKASAEQMIYRFEDGTATVTVQLQKAGAQATFMSVSADFQGTYTLGSQEARIDCTSTGNMERDLIAVAGGSPKGTR